MQHGKLISVAVGVGAWLIAVALGILPGPQWLGWLLFALGSGLLITAGRWWAHAYFRSASPQPPQQTSASPANEQAAAKSTAIPLEEAAPSPIFDEAPAELAQMSPASLRALVADRTNAQIATLMEQHVGKPVRVSGEVERVEFGTSGPSVMLKASVPLLLFFDAEGYDAKPELLTLNKGDKIVASGQIRKFEQGMFGEHVSVLVAVDKCKLVEARRRGP